MRLNRGRFLAAACVVACLVVVQGGASQAVRTLSGHVVDSANQPLYKAVVYLKNTKTLVIRTYITEKDGSYRFSALSPNVDYEVYADHQGDRSETKTLSGFDNRRQVVFTLRIRNR
jgi:hypothetical protein